VPSAESPAASDIGPSAGFAAAASPETSPAVHSALNHQSCRDSTATRTSCSIPSAPPLQHLPDAAQTSADSAHAAPCSHPSPAGRRPSARASVRSLPASADPPSARTAHTPVPSAVHPLKNTSRDAWVNDSVLQFFRLQFASTTPSAPHRARAPLSIVRCTRSPPEPDHASASGNPLLRALLRTSAHYCPQQAILLPILPGAASPGRVRHHHAWPIN
jgi:hypothetical protein